MSDTLYISDLDGTLLGPDGRLSAFATDTLNRLLDSGMLFTVATARTPATVINLLEGLHLRLPAVLMTGSLLYDLPNRQALASTPLSPAALDAVCTLLDSTGQEALLYCAQGGLLKVYYRRLSNTFEETFVTERQGTPYKSFVQTDHFAKATRGSRVLRVLLCLDDAAQASLWYKALTKLDNVACYCTANEYGPGFTVEAYAAGCDKATGMAAVRALCGAGRVVCFGDNVNDLPLFAACDQALAVENACVPVRQAASAVIGANSVDGVALWLAQHAVIGHTP